MVGLSPECFSNGIKGSDFKEGLSIRSEPLSRVPQTMESRNEAEAGFQKQWTVHSVSTVENKSRYTNF